MKLNLLFSVKNIVLLLLALFYLLIFTHNLLGNIFEGYETSDPISSKDDAATTQNKLDSQNINTEMNQTQNAEVSASGDASQPTQGFEDKKDDEDEKE